MERLEYNAKTVVWFTLALGATFGLIEGIAHPQGLVWFAARAIVGVAFVAALAAWLVSAGRRRWSPTR
jgi:hypothetical protein